MNKLALSPFPPRRALIILAPHPDDDVLGCGRLIVAARAAGVRIVVVALTDGQASHPGSRRWPPAALGRLRRGEMRRGLARLGAGRVPLHFLGGQDGALAETAAPLRLRRLLHAIGTGAVAVTSPRDHHPDHQAAWALAHAVAGRRWPVLGYAVWSRSGDGQRARRPGGAAKRRAIAAHRSQLGSYVADDPGGFGFDAATLHRLVDSPETLTLDRGRRLRSAAPAMVRGRR